MDDESSRNWTLQVSSVQKDLTSLQAICSLRSRELQDHKSKNPSAKARISTFSVGSGRSRQRFEDVYPTKTRLHENTQ
jgi:hypothetical protein